MNRFLHIIRLSVIVGVIFQASHVAGQANAPGPVPLRTPVDYFRELLEADAVQLGEELAGRTPGNRAKIIEKIGEYKAMRAEDRELKLRITEIRWHLTELMRLPPDKRSERLARVPEVDRLLIEDRLKRWQMLPPTLQTSLLENESTLDYLVRMGVDTAGEREQLRKILPSPLREELEARLQEWERLPPDQRKGLLQYFKSFFELSDEEQHKVLNSLSETEREQMAQSLRQFEQLDPEKRRQCLDALGRFSVLEPEQRYLFVHNANRWKEMTPSERERWREVVRQLPETQMPPLPPGLNTNLMPPMPDGYTPATGD